MSALLLDERYAPFKHTWTTGLAVLTRMSATILVQSPQAHEYIAHRRGRMPSSTAALIRPVLWALGKRKRAGGDPSAQRAKCGRETAEPPTLDELSTSFPTLDELSTNIPFQYLQAHLYIKRRLYMMSQDPRLLLHAKAIEAEIRRRLAPRAAEDSSSGDASSDSSSSGAR